MPGTHRPPARVRSELFRVYRRLDKRELGLETDGAPEADLGLKDKTGRVRLMFGVYSEEGLRRVFDEYGIIQRLQDRGVGELEVRLHLEDPYRPNVQLWSVTYGAPVVDVTLSQTNGKAAGLPEKFHAAPLLSVESVTLQHPGKTFEWSRPPLPEQLHPGLSLSSDVLDMHVLLAKRIQALGIVLTPSTFHAARIYERHFQFISGDVEGRFRALRHAGELRPLWLLSWAIQLGCVRDGNRPLQWEPSTMLAPLHEALTEIFDSKAYEDAVALHERRALEIDFDLLRERFPWDQMPKSRPPALISALLKPKRS